MKSEREILIIDDNLGIRMGLDHFFAKQGFQVKKAIDCEKGLNYISEQNPLAVICDVSLPGLSGFEGCRIIKANPSTRGIPVILISSHSEAELREKGWEAGADFFICKPVSPIDVVSDMEILFENDFSCPDETKSRLRVIRKVDG